MSDDEAPMLSEETLAILREFQAEQQKKIEQMQSGEAEIDEDWQLSQFWYSEATAETLCAEAISACNGNGRIACISCPTLMKYFHNTKEFSDKNIELRLFEFDDRFGMRFPEEFVFYDYKHPCALPAELKGTFDVIIADPPFLADECLVKTAQTVRVLGKSDCKIIFCTGAVMEDRLKQLLGLKRTQFKPQHHNNLSNDFASFTNFEPKHIL